MISLAMAGLILLLIAAVFVRSLMKWSVLVVISLALYAYLGSYQPLQQFYQQQQRQAVVDATLKEYKTPDAIIDKLKQRLQQDPNSAKGWYLLARIYFTTDQPQLAADAFAKSLALNPDDSNTQLQYAQSLYYANNHRFPDKALQLVNSVLQTQPDHPFALNLKAISDYQTGHYSQAIVTWQKLLAQTPPQSEAYQELVRVINEAKAQLGQGGIPVTVTIKSSVLAKVAADDTVFIYAKALNGPPMPLAIVRKQVKDLPLTVTLSDADAMMPNVMLSKYKNIKIIARISKTGSAKPLPGDWIAQQETENYPGVKVSLDIANNLES